MFASAFYRYSKLHYRRNVSLDGYDSAGPPESDQVPEIIQSHLNQARFLKEFIVANGAPAGFSFLREKHVPGFVEHALSGFGQVSSILGTQGVPAGPIYYV